MSATPATGLAQERCPFGRWTIGTIGDYEAEGRKDRPRLHAGPV